MPTAPQFQPTQHADEAVNRIQADVKKVLDGMQADAKSLGLPATSLATSSAIPAGASVIFYRGGPGQTLTLPAAKAQGANTAALVFVCNVSTNAVTLQPAGGDTVNGVTSLPCLGRSLLVLTSDGINAWIAGPTAASVFGASGPSHSSGLVPDPGATADTSHFLREDATWALATTPRLLLSPATVPANASMFVSESFEIAANQSLELGAGAAMEIG